MTIGSENFGNGSSKTEDRYSAQLGGYRNRREGGSPLPGTGESTDDLSPRNGSALTGGLDRVTMPLDTSPIGSSLTAPKLNDPSLPSSLPELGPLSEPMFGRDAWLDTATGSLADHPLLRGLLLELPPKGTIPQQDWLDRWFEAARSILELLYSQEARA